MSTITHRCAGLLLATAAVAGAAALLPTAAADPTTTEPTTTAPATTAQAQYAIDESGYVDSAARCDDDQTLVEVGRTSRALVAICVAGDGRLEYRGVRLSDKSALKLAASRAADGAVIADNDTVTYTVSKESLLVSEGDQVIYREAWTEFRQPRFPSGTTTTPSTTPSATSSATSSETPTTAPSTTVSTTTVTPTASTSAAAG